MGRAQAECCWRCDAGDVGKEPRAVKEPGLAMIRGSRAMRYDEAAIGTIKQTDRLVVVRSVHDRDADPGPHAPGVKPYGTEN